MEHTLRVAEHKFAGQHEGSKALPNVLEAVAGLSCTNLFAFQELTVSDNYT